MIRGAELLVDVDMVRARGKVVSCLLLWRGLLWLVSLGLCDPSLRVGARWLRVLYVTGVVVVRGVHGDVVLTGTPGGWVVMVCSSVLVCISDCFSDGQGGVVGDADGEVGVGGGEAVRVPGFTIVVCTSDTPFSRYNICVASGARGGVVCVGLAAWWRIVYGGRR